MSRHAEEIAKGERFAFGANWRRFLDELDERRIEAAEASLLSMLERETLEGCTFLDAGSGSGLFSLAARRRGARVRSFDYDPDSVACTAELRRRHFPDDEQWTVEAGSVLDRTYLDRLGTFDVVYSWGVLHHTGAMWDALDNVGRLVTDDGQLFIAIYNDQGWISRRWRDVKELYCSGSLGKAIVTSVTLPTFALEGLVVDTIKLRDPRARYRDAQARGMSLVRDWIDWIGGYPFEVARPEEILAFYRARGYRLDRLITGSSGCNQFVLRRAP